MVLWLLAELAVSTVGGYNIAKGMYNMYKDADNLKDEYKKHRRTVKEYRKIQLNQKDELTESQFERQRGEFVVVEDYTGHGESGEITNDTDHGETENNKSSEITSHNALPQDSE